MNKILAVPLLFVIGFLGCSVQEDESHATARRLIAVLKSGTSDQVTDMLTPETKEMAIDKIDTLKAYAATINLDSIRLLDTYQTWSDDFQQAQLLFDVPNDTGWVLVSVNLVKTADLYKIHGFHLNALSHAQYHANDFTFVGKSFFHYLFMMYATAVLLVTLASIFLCIKSSFRRKWLWILGMVLSFPTINFNWSTGDLGFQPFKFVLLGFSFTKYPLIAPWIVQTTLPLIVLLFLWKWYKSRNVQLQVTEPSPGIGSVAP